MSRTYEKYPEIQSFLNYLQFEKRYSLHTLEAYRNDLEQFFSFVIDQFDSPSIPAILATFIRTWLASLKSEGISAKTINRKASSLKSFFKYQMRLGTVAVSPMVTVSSPKINKRLPEFVLEDNLETLFKHVEFSDDWKGKTESLVLQLFYATGIRLSELINIKEGDIDYSKSQIKVLGKGGKERIIPIPNELLVKLKGYVSQKEVVVADVNNLFINEKGKRLQQRNVYAFVHYYLSLVTTIKKKSPHILRHSFATHLMNNGAELNSVKELLGHASLASTQVYTHNSIDKLKDIFKKAHPKA